METPLRAANESHAEVETLQKPVQVLMAKAKRFWAQKCEQMLAHEAVIEEKDAEIVRLQEQLSSSQATAAIVQDMYSEETDSLSEVGASQGRGGRRIFYRY